MCQYKNPCHDVTPFSEQINVSRSMLRPWFRNVMRSKVDAMKVVATMIRNHLEGIVAWARSRMTNGFLEVLDGLYQAAQRKARGYRRLSTIRSVILLIAGKLDFRAFNPHGAWPTRCSKEPMKQWRRLRN